MFLAEEKFWAEKENRNKMPVDAGRENLQQS